MKIGDLISNQYYGIGIVTEIQWAGSHFESNDVIYRVQFKKFNVGCFFADLKVLNASW